MKNTETYQEYNPESLKKEEHIIKTPQKLKEDPHGNKLNKKLSNNCSTNFSFINTEQQYVKSI
jgi:hypothetical protein